MKWEDGRSTGFEGEKNQEFSFGHVNLQYL